MQGENSQLKERKVDRRIIKTKRAICNALTDILGQKDINDITIKEIADRADVNRKTIYNYYTGIHEIIDDIENSIIASYEYIFNEFKVAEDETDEIPYRIFESLSSIINDNIDFYSRLIKINGNLQFIQKIISQLESRIKDLLIVKGYNIQKTEMMVHYIVNGMIAAYDYWFSSGRVQPLEEFSKDISNLVYKGINYFIDK